MKKALLSTAIALLVVVFPAAAALTFLASEDVTITGITFTGHPNIDMVIKASSTAGSITFNSGVFTVDDPESNFKITCATSTAKAIKATGAANACVKNSTPGTSFLELPTTAGTYTIEADTIDLPHSATYNPDCGAATCESGWTAVGTGSTAGCCANVSWAASYNTYPTCGAATCERGYNLIGSGASAYCSPASGGGGGNVVVETKCQIFDPTANKLVEVECSSIGNKATSTDDAIVEENVSTTPGEPSKDAEGMITLEQIAYDAQTIFSGGLEKILSEMGVDRNPALKEQFKPLVEKIRGDTQIGIETYDRIWHFITYGTKSTKHLGAGERAGVINSFKAAFGKLPETETDWEDVIKIGNGRWPTQRSVNAENKAKEMFKKIYLKDANMENSNDNAAVTIMSYGLRPFQRNMASEKTAIKTFESIFKYSPSSATDWDAVRAIAYSGATR